MDGERATEILRERRAISEDGGLYNLGWYLGWNPHRPEAVLDGDFTADELEAIAWWMRNHGAGGAKA